MDDTNILLNGVDDEKNIVAIEVYGNDAVVYKREKGEIVSYKDSYKAFMWTKDFVEFPPSIKERTETYNLQGSGDYNKIVFFDNPKDMFSFTRGYVPPTNEILPIEDQKSYKDFHLRKDLAQQYLTHSGKTLFKGMKYNDLKIMAIDLETDGLDQVEIYNNFTRKMEKCYTCNIEMIGISTNYDFETVLHGEQKSILEQFVEVVNREDPDVLLTYNGFEFDWNVLCYQAERLGVELLIGRNKRKRIKKFHSTIRFGDNKNMQITEYGIYGRHNIDIYYAVKKYDSIYRVFEGSSLSLKNVIKELGLEREGRVHISGDEIARLLKEDFEKVKDYCLDDVRDTIDLGEFLLPVDFHITQMVPLTFQKVTTVGNSAKIASLFYRAYYLYETAIPEPEEKIEFVGALSKCDLKGTNKNAFHFDVSSLYPSLMLVHNIFPKSDELKVCLKLLFKIKEERIRTKELERIEKDEHKKKEYGSYQSALKIFLNSFYGCYGSPYFPWNYMQGAAKVTEEGRKTITRMVSLLEDASGVVTNLDTDGVYIVFQDFQKWNDIICKDGDFVVPEY